MKRSEDIRGGLALKMWEKKVGDALRETVAGLRAELNQAASVSVREKRLHEGVECVLARGVRDFCRSWILEDLTLRQKVATEMISSRHKIIATLFPK